MPFSITKKAIIIVTSCILIALIITAVVLSKKPTPLSDAEQAGIIQMLNEEKLARDVYSTLGETWNKPIFVNIASSEQAHMDALKTLVMRYHINNPVSNDAVGIFSDTATQKLYNNYIAIGKKSYLDALNVGLAIEKLDINDLEAMKQTTSRNDILMVYNQLQNGSRNHLEAFSKNITSQDSTLKSSTQNTGATTTELSSDRGDGARGAQKKNRDASDLQNDLNSINP